MHAGYKPPRSYNPAELVSPGRFTFLRPANVTWVTLRVRTMSIKIYITLSSPTPSSYANYYLSKLLACVVISHELVCARVRMYSYFIMLLAVFYQGNVSPCREKYCVSRSTVWVSFGQPV